MKKQNVIAMTLGVWALALSSAAALAYDLNRPLVGADGLRAPRRAPASPTAPLTTAPKLPDISAMSCADWRSLDMGSGRVQVCESAP